MNTLENELKDGNSSIAAEFKQIIKGKNFITPHILGYLKKSKKFIEISKGDFIGKIFYGVTVVENGQPNHELGKCCSSLDEVTQYINSL